MQVVLLNPPRGIRRRRSSVPRRRRVRNTKWVPEMAESPAGLNPRGRGRSHRRKRARNTKWVPAMAESPASLNPRGRRRSYRRKRARNTKWVPEMAESPASLNPKRRGRSRRRFGARRRNPYWVPRYAMNPGRILGAVTSGFSPKVLKETLPLVVGGLGNNLLTGVAAKSLPLPAALTSPPGNVFLSVVGAAVLGTAVGMADKDTGSKVFLGGLVDSVKKAVDWLVARVGHVSGLSCGPACMADYLSVGDAAGARRLGYMPVEDVNALSPVGVPGGLSTEVTVEQELAG